MISTISHEANAYQAAREAEAFFTPQSVRALMRRGEAGELDWADVADMLLGAIADKRRAD